MSDTERTIEFEFVRATENAALNSVHWLGRGEKELADAAACDAIYGVFDNVNICGSVVIGEGIKDNAPGIFLGEKLGTWLEGSPRFDIALDPIDGTNNIALGLPNSISVLAGSEVKPGATGHNMRNLPSFYAHKLAFGPAVVEAVERGMKPLSLDEPIGSMLPRLAEALDKRVQELVIVTMNRPRHNEFITAIRKSGAALRLITDGDIAAAVAPSLPDSGVDLYVGIGGSPEGVLTAAALRALGGEMLLRMAPRDEEERAEILAGGEMELERVFTCRDLVQSNSALFCATGISDSSLVPGVKLVGHTAITHTILMRAKSRTVRYIRAVHDLKQKTIHLRSVSREQGL